MRQDRRWALPWRAPADVAVDAREEIDSHIAMHVADLVAEGWSRGAATAEALRRFGDRDRFEREVIAVDRRELRRARRRGVAADLVQDARLAVRNLGRQRAFALAAILVIGLGVGAGTAVFAVVDAAFFRPLPFPDGDGLVFLWNERPDESRINASLPDFRDLEREADFLDSAMAAYDSEVRWRTDAGWEVLVAGIVAGDVRQVMGGEPLLGRWFTTQELRIGAQVALLDERTWRRRFGGRADILGAEVRLERGVHTIIGVARGETALLRAKGGDENVDLWLPLIEKPWMERDLMFLRILGRRKPGVTLQEAGVRTNLLAHQLQPDQVGNTRLVVEPAREVLVGDNRPMLLALAGAALFVLLAVCANLGNLFLWKSLARGREFTVRAALGASRGRLIRQVLTESLVLGLLGGLVALLMADLLIGFTRSVADRAGALSPDSSADLRVVAFSIALALVVGMVFGLWPALRAARADLAGALKQESAQLTTRSSPWRRKALVALEVALSIMLVAGTGLLVRSLARMLDQDPGFVAEDVLALRVDLPEAQYDDARSARFAVELRERVGALPGVVAFGAATELPLQGGDTTGGFEVVGRHYTDQDRPNVKKRVVGPGYFDALRIPIVRGRDLSERDRAGAADVVVISQAVARLHFPGQDPVGKRIRFNWGPGDEQEIVGVVGDVRHDGLDRPVEGIIYRPIAQMPHRGPTFVVRAAGDPATIAGTIRREIARIDPEVAMSDVRTMADIASASIAPRRSLIFVLAGFALIAALLAAVGAYAVTSQMVALRTPELGLRMALGARPGDILRLVLREGAVMIGLGAAAGLAGAMAATRVLASMLYGVSPHDPVSFAAAIALLAAIAAVAIYVPARRAARLDPMIALRAS